MRDPYEVLGVSEASRATSRAPSGGSPRSCIPTPTSTTPRRPRSFAELNAAYEILGEDDKRKAFDRGEIDAEGKPRFQGFEGFGGRAGAAASAGQAASRPSPGDRTAFRAAAARAGGGGFGGIDDILKEVFGGGRRGARGGAAAAIRADDFGGGAGGQDVTAVAHHHARRSRQGRDAARAAADRQGGRGQDSGRPRRRPADQAERARGSPGPAAAPATC